MANTSQNSITQEYVFFPSAEETFFLRLPEAEPVGVLAFWAATANDKVKAPLWSTR